MPKKSLLRVNSLNSGIIELSDDDYELKSVNPDGSIVFYRHGFPPSFLYKLIKDAKLEINAGKYGWVPVKDIESFIDNKLVGYQGIKPRDGECIMNLFKPE